MLRKVRSHARRVGIRLSPVDASGDGDGDGARGLSVADALSGSGAEERARATIDCALRHVELFEALLVRDATLVAPGQTLASAVVGGHF